MLYYIYIICILHIIYFIFYFIYFIYMIHTYIHLYVYIDAVLIANGRLLPISFVRCYPTVCDTPIDDLQDIPQLPPPM
jgi:hypothetical protein